MMVSANGRKHAILGNGEGDQFLHNQQDELGSRGDREFFEKAVKMGMRCVFLDFESCGNPLLWKIVKHALDDLQFALRHAQGTGNLKPSIIGEQCGSPQLAARLLPSFDGRHLWRLVWIHC